MKIGALSDKQIDAFIENYIKRGVENGGKFSLAELRLERIRRSKSPFPARDTAMTIVELAQLTDDGLVSYKQIWEQFRPGKTWTGNAPRSEMAKALAQVIAYCADNDLPVLTTLVVRGDSRSHSEQAVENIYNEARSLGFDVGSDAKAFVEDQQAQARALSVSRFVAD